MPLLESHHRILSCAESERVPKIWHFVWNLRLVLCRNNTVLTMRGLYMLPKAPITIVIQLRKIMNQSSSNGCLSLQHNTPFPTLRGYLKSDIFMKFESVFLQKWHYVDYKGFVDAISSSYNHSNKSVEDYETVKQKCMSPIAAEHYISSAERVPQIRYISWNLGLVLAEMTQCWP